MRGLVLTSILLACAPASAQDCDDVECSGHGVCFAERGAEACLCEPGYSAVGLTCVPGDGGLEVMRARHQPGMRERVVAIAEAQVGRTRRQVEHDGDALHDYLAPLEWWCGDFVSWVYARAGVPFDGGSMGGWLITNNHAIERWFASRELWTTRQELGDAVPQPGDFVRFPTERGGHAAIVVEVRGTTLYTVEGNVGSEVERARYFHYPDNPLIAGFGRLILDNAAPRVEAPESLEAIVGEPIELEGEVEDDGPLHALVIGWSAPFGARVEHATDPVARAVFDRPGRFELTLEANDGEHASRAQVTVHARRDDPPSVVLTTEERGPLFARLRARVEDEGAPTLAWSVVSGPGEVELSSPARASTDAHFDAAGRYVLALEADDGRHRSEQRVTVDVESGAFGCRALPGRAPSAWLALPLALLVRARRKKRRGAA